jgi:hypothetical protein
MRNGQNKRMRGRNRGKGGHHHQNPLSRVYESNGPDVKIRGTASHIAEKYVQLARDAQSSGDPVAAENYYQHAEHYFRLIAAAQEQLRQTQPYYQQQGDARSNGAEEDYDDGEADQPAMGGEPFAPQPQPFYPREQQNQPQQFQPQQQQPQHYQPRPQQHVQAENDSDIERLPSFITGGQSQPAPAHNQASNGQNGQNGNGYDGGSPDRFPLHRRRRRHRGPRDHGNDHSGDNAPQGGSSDE